MNFSSKLPLISVQSLLGLTNLHVDEWRGVKLHRDVVEPVARLHQASLEAGYEVKIVSGFRPFERQLTIWNSKAAGLRPILDSDGQPLARSELSETEAVFAILRWSALPGASRHHWGTDFDVVDARALYPGYDVQLTVAETTEGGIFAPFHIWLAEHLSEQHAFFRPYAIDTGGVACEPWHLSYAPVSRPMQEAYSLDALRRQISQADMLLKEQVLANLDEIYHRFVHVDWHFYP